jgi:hypothetical protein
MHYIYKINHISGKNYIGQTIEIKERFSYHKRKIKNKKHDNFLLNEDSNINNYDFTIIDEVDNQETADFLEKYYINEYKSFHTDNGFNLTPGGKGFINYRSSKKVFTFKLNGDFIKEYKSIRECARELKLDAGGIYRNCIGKYNKSQGYVFSYGNNFPMKINKVRKVSKRVAKYDEYGGFIESYQSIKDAAKKNNIKHPSCLTNAIKNKTFSYGFYWGYYKNNDSITISNKKCLIIPIKLYKNGVFITIFSNQKEVADYIKGSVSNVNHCLKGRRKSYLGYTFKYSVLIIVGIVLTNQNI